MNDDAIRLRSVSRRYGSGDSTVTALDEVSLAFPRGTFTAVMGPSGSGKSTLLQCAAGLDRPTSGSVAVGGTELTGLSERRLTLLRRERIGFVFQAFNLLSTLTAEQNVELPLRLAGRRPSRAQVREALAQVGLGDRARHRPAELSGGQQQRVALARALITRPEVAARRHRDPERGEGHRDARADHRRLRGHRPGRRGLRRADRGAAARRARRRGVTDLVERGVRP
ncbi:Vitamin B12 import ATP-binding protein BtuD [Streptomyces hirsutus]